MKKTRQKKHKTRHKPRHKFTKKYGRGACISAALNSDVLGNLNDLFPNTDYFVVKKYQDECDGYYEIYSNPNKHCLTFTIDLLNKKIKIEYLTKCKISGDELLKKIDALANNLKIKIIELQDASRINFTKCPSEIKVNLSLLLILSRGETFYNKRGYSEINRESNKQHNEIQINKTLKDFFSEIFEIKYETNKKAYENSAFFRQHHNNKSLPEILNEDQTKNKSTMKNVIQIVANYEAEFIEKPFAKSIEETVDETIEESLAKIFYINPEYETMTVKEFFGKIKEILLLPETTCVEVDEIDTLLLIIESSEKIMMKGIDKMSKTIA
jgi:hypothetical protein